MNRKMRIFEASVLIAMAYLAELKLDAKLTRSCEFSRAASSRLVVTCEKNLLNRSIPSVCKVLNLLLCYNIH